MKLIPVNPHDETHLKVLYDLLAERAAEQNISHKKMPTWDSHRAFALACGYEAWYLVGADDKIVGSVYLTKRDEIGIHIFHEFWCLGFGGDACYALMEKHGPRRYLWNVNPKNLASIALARKLGFTGPIQHTYQLEAK